MLMERKEMNIWVVLLFVLFVLVEGVVSKKGGGGGGVNIWPMPVSVSYGHQSVFMSKDFKLKTEGSNYKDASCILKDGFSRFLDVVRLGSLWNNCLQDDGVIFNVVAATIHSFIDIWLRIRVCFYQNAAALSSAIQCCI